MEPTERKLTTRISERPYDPNGPLIVLLIVIVLTAIGWWLVTRVHENSTIQDCVMAGRKNCAPVDTDSLPR